jgi:hypothetical protein
MLPNRYRIAGFFLQRNGSHMPPVDLMRLDENFASIVRGIFLRALQKEKEYCIPDVDPVGLQAY